MKAKEKTTKNKKTATSQPKTMTKAKPKTKSVSTAKRSSSTSMLSERMATTSTTKSGMGKSSMASTPLMTAATTPMARTSGLKKPGLWLIGAWIVIIAVALYYFRGQFIVATVNGQPILRSTLVRELEKQNGRQVLDNIVLKTVIMQEAAKQKVGVTPQEVDDEIVKLEDTFKNRGQDLSSALAVQGMSRDDLKEQMMLQKLVERMVSKDGVTVTDDEVKEYMEANKAFLPKDAKPDELNAEVRRQLEQQKQTAKIQEWVTKLKDEAKVEHWLFQ